jgi:hypothetical protein
MIMEEENLPVEACTAKDIEPAGLHERIDEVTAKLLAMPQAPMPVIHRFSRGLYIREVYMTAGAFVIGFEHKAEHFNVMLQGHLVMVNDDGTTTNYIAPQSYSSPPGRKVAYIVKDVVWQNIFPTDETDIDVLEDELLIKTEDYQLNEAQRKTAERVEHEPDRFHYADMLAENGLTEQWVRMMSENQFDQIDFPGPVHPYRLAESPIEGTGYYLTVPARAGMILAPARIGDKRAPADRYVNHSGTPNAAMQKGEDGNLYLVAIANIDGCLGGGIGTEVTTDYGETLKLIVGEALCQA